MQIKDLTALYLSELQEASSFEGQVAGALPELADRASDPALRAFLSDDMPEARLHGERVSGLLEAHGATERHTDGSMQRILGEARDWAAQIDDPSVRDAALIASTQRILHYEMAVYGSLADWAKQLGLSDLETLVAILEEDKRADARLTQIAKDTVNAKAAA
ncbi:DUF892 family protein [Psychromarinibacter sp. C21-152]|uniref:DUF892 family protein n=1 Tax=Psychromarinibacter sediminicola TaxID=3033385 RepID=A0AAE3T8M0_9RHOB|nr:DUF892 family protein [Psychromarinibacter sediminicola]MDF0601565.1 DUF892 family protein [Psychromarinibacter sediminicola]